MMRGIRSNFGNPTANAVSKKAAEILWRALRGVMNQRDSPLAILAGAVSLNRNKALQPRIAFADTKLKVGGQALGGTMDGNARIVFFGDRSLRGRGQQN